MLRVLPYVIVLNLICSLAATGQDYSYVNYNTREGLAGSVVYCMVQDHDGFMWFGTETGLSRFDGTRFKNYTTADGLPDNDVIRLFVDSKNRVWIAPFKNALSYYWRGKIYNAGNDSVLSRLNLKAEIRGIAENPAGDVAIIETEAVTIINNDGRISKFTELEGSPVVAAFWTGVLSSGNFGFAVTTSRGVCLYELTKDSLHRYFCRVQNFNKDDFFHPRYISSRLEIWRNQDSLQIITPQDGVVAGIRLPEQFTSFTVLNDSLISINSAKAEIYDVKKKKIQRVLLEGKITNAVYIDREKNYWIATAGEGLFRLPSLEYKNYVVRDGENALPVYSLLKSGDTLFAGSGSSIVWTINTKTGTAVPKKIFATPTIGRVTTLNKLRDGSLLAGTDHKLLKISGDKITPAKDVYTAIKSTFISGDTITLALSTGVHDLEAKHLKIIDSIWTGRATVVYKKDGHTLVGTLNGLYIIDREHNARYGGDLHASLEAKISAIVEDANGNTWIATLGSGVIGYKNGKVFAFISEANGLTSNICRSLFAGTGALWVGTDKGLNEVTVSNDTFRIMRYTTSDGLASNIINNILVQDSIVYVATSEGITWFDESKVNTNSICLLKITSVQTPAHTWLYDTSGLILPYSGRDIRIEFAGISLKSAGGISYRYRLKGLHEQWQQTSDNFLNYAALPSGKYTLELQAINKFDISSEIKTLAFTIAKPLWEKNWFRLLTVLLIFASVWLLLHYRIRSDRKKQAQKEATNRKMAQLEQMALKAQMNPHFIFNSLHSIQQYVLDKDIRGANKFITDFARLIRLTLNISMQPKILLHDEINYISTYLELEKTRLEGKFDYKVEVADVVNVLDSYIPVMILQPFVENAIRHGVANRNDKDGLIKVMFHIEMGYLVCIIEDNGIGRMATYAMKQGAAHEHESKGMMLTKNRIELLNKDYELPILSDIEDKQLNNVAAGTRVTIRFPLTEVKKPA